MKVTKPAYEWTGEHRPPKKDEYFRHDGELMRADGGGIIAFDIYREVQREHGVPEAVPEWIMQAAENSIGINRRGFGSSTRDVLDHIGQAFRSHVDRCAKEAAERWAKSGTSLRNGSEEFADTLGRVIREEFLR